MWAPGMGELLVLLVIVLVIFGAGKLPQVGRALGGAINEFKDSVTPKDKDDKDEPAPQPTTSVNASKEEESKSEPVESAGSRKD